MVSGVLRFRGIRFLGILFLFFSISASADVAQTTDAFLGLENPTYKEWAKWYQEMLNTRSSVRGNIGFDPQVYAEPHSTWSDSSFRQFKVFIYDQRFYRDGSYHTQELIDGVKAAFGGADSVLLWHAYPRVGFDSRTQFDFYRDMPGGLKGLRAQVDIFHANGIKVFVNYNPWDVGGDDNPDVDSIAYQNSYRELAQIIATIDADGIMLDTLNSVPTSLRQILDAAKPGVVLAPERRASDNDLNWARQSWAQWYDIGNNVPSVYRHKWIVPQHQQYATRRWDTNRQGDIVYSFFNGSGLLVWENIYGAWNPYSKADRVLLAQTQVVLKTFGEIFTKGTWLPLYPSGQKGLDVNFWRMDDVRLFTFRNRTAGSLYFKIPDTIKQKPFTFWEEKKPKAGYVEVPANGTQAAALADETFLSTAKANFDAAAKAAEQASYDSTITPELTLSAPVVPTSCVAPSSDMRPIPGGKFTMQVSHMRRECGCYSRGATANARWGSHWQDTIDHKIETTVRGFSMKTTAVTNAEYLEFVSKAHYEPKDSENFLKHIPRNPDGTLPEVLFSSLAEMPVTYVSLDDARAYANWKGQRLPTEEEWQWAAEGAGLGNKWPWGNSDSKALNSSVVNLSGSLAEAASYPSGATPQGLLQMTGNVWEMTESHWTDGHNRFLILRGGVYLPSAASVWVIPRGPRPNSFHAKYMLMADGLDRSETVGFRTVVSTE